MLEIKPSNDPEWTLFARLRDIRNVTWPKEYDEKRKNGKYLHDIALVELKTRFKAPFQYGFEYRSACLADSNFVERYEGPLMVIGFGFTRPAIWLNSHPYSLVDLEYRSRYLKVGYVQDRTAQDCFPRNVSTDCRDSIFVYNQTEPTNEMSLYSDAGMLHKIARIQKTWSI